MFKFSVDKQEIPGLLSPYVSRQSKVLIHYIHGHFRITSEMFNPTIYVHLWKVSQTSNLDNNLVRSLLLQPSRVRGQSRLSSKCWRIVPLWKDLNSDFIRSLLPSLTDERENMYLSMGNDQFFHVPYDSEGKNDRLQRLEKGTSRYRSIPSTVSLTVRRANLNFSK